MTPTRIRIGALAALVLTLGTAPAPAAHAQDACGSDAALAALENPGDASIARLAGTLMRGRTPALEASQRADHCRYVPSLRVVRRTAQGRVCGSAVIAASADLTGCTSGATGHAPDAFFFATTDARGRVVTRAMASNDPRLEAPAFDANTSLTARCAAYESDITLSAPALEVVRSATTTFAGCTARGLDAERIRREVGNCLESHRAADALITFAGSNGAEVCRVVVRTERVGTNPWTRVSASSLDAAFSHSYGTAGSTRCDAMGPVDDLGCSRGTPMRRAADATCTIAAADARALSAAPARFLCIDDAELRGMHITTTAQPPTATAFTIAPIFGMLARGVSQVDDASVNAFVAAAALQAANCTDRGSPPATRHRSDLLVTFTVGTDGVGAISSSALSFDNGIARCVAEAVRDQQANLRSPPGTTVAPIYQYTLAVLRP